MLAELKKAQKMRKQGKLEDEIALQRQKKVFKENIHFRRGPTTQKMLLPGNDMHRTFEEHVNVEFSRYVKRFRELVNRTSGDYAEMWKGSDEYDALCEVFKDGNNME